VQGSLRLLLPAKLESRDWAGIAEIGLRLAVLSLGYSCPGRGDQGRQSD